MLDQKQKRPDFTVSQLRASLQTGYIAETQRERRPHIASHPIDNVPPETPADRDDGIYVEASQQGKGYRVHVTIADVAGHIAPENPLFSCIWQRAFTTYRPWRNDPMFPKSTEHRMSLEHGQERLGMTITFDLDAAFNVTHRSFRPTLTTPDNSSYRMAGSRMQTEPQFQLMAHIADGIRANIGEDIVTRLSERESRLVNLNAGEKRAMRVNEIFMILSNIEMANFFHAADLPFVYRNFTPSSTADKTTARAYYSIHPEGHEHMQKSGWDGYYSHVTSPIRRGPDVFNQHMQHYVHGLVTELHQQLSRYVPTDRQQDLLRILWENAPQWISESRSAPIREEDGTQYPQRTDAMLTNYVHQSGGHLPVEDAEAYAAKLSKKRPPFQRKDLGYYVNAINRLNDIEHDDTLWLRRDARFEERLTQRQAKLAALNGETSTLDNHKFSDYLRDAALTGLLPDPLRIEALERIRKGEIHTTRDGLSIMVLADHPGDPAWHQLKRAMSRAIKHDPSAVNGILELAQRSQLFPGKLDMAEASLPLASAHTRPDHIESAILTMQEAGGQQVAPPYYSIGHDSRSARSHAQYSFLEYYAFGQLRPLEQSAVPNLLYAELGDSEQSRRSLVENIASHIGSRLTLTHSHTAEGTPRVDLRMAGGSLASPIHIHVSGRPESTPALLEASALRRLLRDPIFQDSTIAITELGLREMLRPQPHLQSIVDEKGGALTLNIGQKRLRGGQMQYTVDATLHLPGEDPVQRRSIAPNKDRALNDACTRLLDAKGWLTSPPIDAKGWVSRNRPRPGGAPPQSLYR